MIKNIIFDFGDVFINLNKDATHDALQKLGVTSITPEMMEVYYSYEKGLLTSRDFIAHFHGKFGIAKMDLLKAWNAILLDFPEHRFHFIKRLAASKKYRLFLLSNTNELHIDWIQKDWGNKIWEEFKNCFEKFYLSHEIHLRKPNLDIYTYVLEENNLIPGETIFIDDTKENTDAAKSLGMHVWNINPEIEDISNLTQRKQFS